MTLLCIAVIVFSPYLALLPMIVVCIRMFAKNNFIIIKNFWNMGLLFLFIWSFIVGILNKDMNSMLASFVILIYFFIGVYLQSYYNKEEKIERLLKNIVLISIISGIIGVIEWITPIQYKFSRLKYIMGIYPFRSFEESYRISGTFGNPNVAGIWYAAMVVICFYFYKKKSGINKIFYAGVSMLFIADLVMTRSRGAIMALLVGIIIYTYFTENKRKTLFWVTLLLLGIVVMFKFPYFFPRGEGIFISIKDRKLIWKNCLNMFLMKPLTGWGLMGIYFAKPEIFDYVRTVHGHNIWITIGTTMGSIGLVVFVCMQLYLFNEMNKLKNKKNRLLPLLASLQAIILSQGLVDFTIINPQAGIIYFGCSAIISGLVFEHNSVTIMDSIPILLPFKVKNK